MARVNTARQSVRTHEGATAKHINPYQQLRRTVMSCMLWENQFYENGVSIADRIKALVPQVDALDVAALAVEARTEMKLRHVPLLLVRELVRHPNRKGVKVGQAIANVIQRADELTEFLAIYWMDGRVPLAKQVKVGLAMAFQKFDAYQLAKYDRGDAIRLRRRNSTAGRSVPLPRQAEGPGAGEDLEAAGRRHPADAGYLGNQFVGR